MRSDNIWNAASVALEPFGLTPQPGESLDRFCARAGRRLPLLASALADLNGRYQALRFAPPSDRRRQRQQLRKALRRLRQELRRQSRRPLERFELEQGR